MTRRGTGIRLTSLGATVAAVAALALLGTPTQGAAAPTCAGRTATIVGTAGHDELRGTNGPDVIAARGGSDDIEARGGNDVVCGNLGNDELEGGRGDDRLYGGPGRDEAEGGPGSDICVAEERESC